MTSPRARPSRNAAVVLAAAGAMVTACHAGEAERPTGYTQYQAVLRASSPESAEFTAVQAMDVDSHGNVYAADRVNVAVLSPDAKPLRRFGREGNGPGEFRGVTGIRLLHGDSVFTFDSGASRVTVWSPASSHPAYTLSLGAGGYFFPYWVEPVSDGALLATFRAAYGVGADGGLRGKRLETMRLLNPDASLRQDSVLTFPEYEAVPIQDGTRQGTLFDPFGRRMLVAVRRDRVYSAWSGDWRVEVNSITGRHLRTIRPEGAPPPRPITAAEMDSIVGEMKRDLPFSRASIRRALEGAGHHTWPLLQDIVVDDANRLWLAVTGLRGEPVHWIATDEQGRRVGSFDISERVKLHLIRGSTAYGVILDENDVPHVVIYDLKPVHSQPGKRS